MSIRGRVSLRPTTWNPFSGVSQRRLWTLISQPKYSLTPNLIVCVQQIVSIYHFTSPLD